MDQKNENVTYIIANDDDSPNFNAMKIVILVIACVGVVTNIMSSLYF